MTIYLLKETPNGLKEKIPFRPTGRTRFEIVHGRLVKQWQHRPKWSLFSQWLTADQILGKESK